MRGSREAAGNKKTANVVHRSQASFFRVHLHLRVRAVCILAGGGREKRDLEPRSPATELFHVWHGEPYHGS